MRRRRPLPLLLAGLLALSACAKGPADWRRDLASEDPYQRRLAVVALAQSGDPAVVDDLCRAITDEDAEVVREARAALASFAPVVVPRLLEGLADRKESGARNTLVTSGLLIEMGAPAVPPMVAALRDGRQPRLPIALTLGRMGEPGVTALVELLAAPEPELAAAAARGLAGSGESGRAARPALEAARQRSEPAVVEAANAALAALGVP